MPLHSAARRNDIKTIMILGSGPIVIGQGAEFDYSGTQAVRALKQQRGRAIHAVGGAGLVSSLMNEGLVDELRLISTPSSWARESGCFSTSSARTPWFFWAPSGSGRARCGKRPG